MAREEPTAHLRPEIQGLRAVAVLLVLGYHLSPDRITGGYVGVDVFFVISGYLITAHLNREVRTTGTLSLSRFWSRRARRLLPASLLVLAVCTVVTATVVPRSMWDQTLHQIAASATYWQNWALASDAVDYSARGNVPTLVQHYWSLSVEEQFYLGWPVIVLAVAVVLRRRGAEVTRRGLVLVVAALAVASLACSVLLTRHSPGSAYFVTETRIWELAVGALLALAGDARRARGPRTGLALGWAGIAAMIGAGLAFDSGTPFPGWAALLPVLGAAAVIAAGPATSSWSAAHWLGTRPCRFVGDISYSVYLWHWPLIVGVPYLTKAPLGHVDKIAILVVTLVLAWACTRFVEDPVRRVGSLVAVPWRTLVGAATAVALVLGATLLLHLDLDREVAAAHARTDQALARWTTRGCLGPPALDPSDHCVPPQGKGPLLSAAEIVARQNTKEAYPGCQADQDKDVVVSCTLGDRRDPVRTVAVVGDSHATMWFPALDRLGRRERWRVVTYSRSSCPFTDAWRLLPGYETGARKAQVCARADAEVTRRLLAARDTDTVFAVAYSSAYHWTAPPGQRMRDPAVDGFRLAWRPLLRAGKHVVVLRDVPAVKDRVNTPDCLSRHPGDVMACALPRGRALLRDVQAEAARAERTVGLVDLTRRFCDAQWCYAVVGDVIVYRDYSHLSTEYSELMAPYLLEALDRIGRGPP